MSYYLKMVGLATGEASDLDGLYVKAYDPDFRWGRGEIVGTKDKDEALKFETLQGALTEYRRTSKVRPLRPDGKPNRPLTAYTIEVVHDV
jgi:hypothetical protein